MSHLRLFTGIALLLLLPAAGLSQSVQLADSLNRQGMDYYESGNYREAEFYLREAFLLYEKQATPDVWLSPGIDYAEILVDRSKYEQALPLFEQLKKVAVSQNNIQAQARIENDLGWLRKKVGLYEKALQHLRDAIPLAEESQDTLRLGYIYNNIGSIYNAMGDYEASLKYREKSLFFKNKTDDKQGVSITLNNLGYTYKKLSFYDKALEYYTRSLAIRKELNNADLLGAAYNNVASLYSDIGEYDKALINYQLSLEYKKSTGDPSSSATTLNNIGTLYGVLGQPEQELAYYQKSMKLKEQYANAASLAVTYSNIASSFGENGQREKALAYYQQALELRKRAGNPRAIASTFLDLAQFEKNRNQFLKSDQYIAQARTIADSTRDRSLQQKTFSLEGDLKFAQGNYKGASRKYKKAWDYSRSLGKSARIRPLKGLAYSYHQLNSDSALHYGQQAIDFIETMRSQTGPLSRFKSGYFKQHAGFYKAMASWALEYEESTEEAFRLVESAKARALADELSEAVQRIDESLPEKERIKRAQQLSDITDLYSQLKNTTDTDKQQNLKSKIYEKELAYASFEHELTQKFARYKRLENPDPISLQQARRICDASTAVLEYALTDDQLLIFFISSQEVQTRQFSFPDDKNLDSGSSPLSQIVLNFRDAILSRAPKDSIQSISRILYAQLIAPFKDQLSSYENIIIIPDMVLAYMPFEALYDGNNYLVSQFNIKYSPSFTGLSLLPKPTGNSPPKLLAIGNSNQSAPVSNMPVLPSVNFEIESIARIFSDVTIINDAEATESSVKNILQEGFSMVHIAAHSVIDEQNSSLSGIVLGKTKNEIGIGDDGLLQNSEIHRLKISSDMVVLSACKSGIGNLMSGEGMLGLQRAFFNSGASTVVVSLWDVYDRSTTQLMRDFYTAVKDRHKNKTWSDSWNSFLRWAGWDDSMPFGDTASAMRKAKLAMIEHPRYNHPVYWAPFVVVGR